MRYARLSEMAESLLYPWSENGGRAKLSFIVDERFTLRDMEVEEAYAMTRMGGKA